MDDETFCMSGKTLRAALTPDTKVVIPVPIYGNLAGLDEVVSVAREAGVRVMVDSAQAHGARLASRRLVLTGLEKRANLLKTSRGRLGPDGVTSAWFLGAVHGSWP